MAASILERILNLMPLPGETPAQFTRRSERLRLRLIAERDARLSDGEA